MVRLSIKHKYSALITLNMRGISFLGKTFTRTNTMSVKVSWVLIIIGIFTSGTNCSKILIVFSSSVKSHYIVGSSLAKGLAAKNHEVTMISCFGEKNHPKTYRDIIIENVTSFDEDTSVSAFGIPDMDTLTFLIGSNILSKMTEQIIFNSKTVQDFLKSNETFDVIILEQFYNDFLRILGHHFKAPLIVVSTFSSNNWVNSLVGNPEPPSYVPYFSTKFSHLHFFDRLYNFLIAIARDVYKHIVLHPLQNEILKKHFHNPPEFSEIANNVSLVLVNSHWSVAKPVPRVPNMIDIGGIHIRPTQELPKHLQEYLDNSKQGVIYFSMGSSIRGSSLPNNTRNALAKAFAQLHYNILWKWEGEVLPEMSANVKVEQWLPQQDVLAHPNVKLFISQCGILSLMESVYHGVPILGLPVFAEQWINADTVVRNNLGIYMRWRELTEQKLLQAINNLMHNETYRENMQQRSKIMRDRQREPIDETDYWIQYVIRHQGAPHLRNDGLDLTWYQYLCLDVILFLTSSSVMVIYLLFICIKCTFCKNQGKKNKLKIN